MKSMFMLSSMIIIQQAQFINFKKRTPTDNNKTIAIKLSGMLKAILNSVQFIAPSIFQNID